VEANRSSRAGVEQGSKMQEKETLDERLPNLFEPDTLLPIQYFEAMRKKHLLEGEKRLILSVLEDAVECFMKCIDAATNKGQRLFREADEWIAHEDKRWVFSFDNVCDMLDINADYMRLGLGRWKERKIESIARRRAEAEAEAANPALPEPVAAVPSPAPKPAAVFAKPAAVHHREHEHRARPTHASSKRRRVRA
jgi:hypothetical protein